MASSASTLPWLWVIEALASSKQVDSSILIDLVKKTPEISDNIGKNSREMVSLRILESFVAQRKVSTNDVSSSPDSKIEFDLSEDCEDVVRHIMHEISASNLRMDEPEVLKWDAQTFITHKRACLPKCTLQQLKDAILEVNHPILASLKERSGLSVSNQSENKIAVDDGDLNVVLGRLEGSCTDGQTMAAGGNLTSPAPANSDGLLQEDLPNRNLLRSKRDRSDIDTENQAAKSLEDHIIMDNECDPHLHNYKKLKQDANFTSQAVGQKSVPVVGNELSEDLFRRNGQHTVGEGADLAKSSQVGGLEQSRFSKASHEQHIATKRPGQRNDADDAGLQHNHPPISCNNNAMPQDTSGDGLHWELSVNEAKDDGKHCTEMGTSNAAPLDGTHQNICGDETRDRCEKSQINVTNGALLDESYRNNFPGEAKDDMEHNPGLEVSSDSDGYQDEKVDVAMKKRTFLSTQCTFSQDSLATSDFTELNLCMKCNKGGQLLVCSASACPLVVHQGCLGSAPSFDDSGNFYCPFCAYSHAISKYIEVKKKASLARKDLATFIGLENGQRANKFSRRFLRPEQNQMRQDDNVNGNNRANHSRNHVNEVNSSQFRENIEDKREVEPSASCVNGNLPCGEGVATVNDGRLLVLIEHNREGGKMGPESQYTSVLEGQQIEAQDGCKVGDDDSSCRDRETVHVTKRRADGIREGVLPQPLTDSPQQATSQPNIDAEGSSKEENDKPTSSYFIRFRRREKKYTYPAIPQLRRKKVPWTAVEEETLKEGVRRFSSVHDRNIPWKSILEFGSDVFQKGRTTIDLKDKWRNICRGSPKSK